MLIYLTERWKFLVRALEYFKTIHLDKLLIFLILAVGTLVGTSDFVFPDTGELIILYFFLLFFAAENRFTTYLIYFGIFFAILTLAAGMAHSLVWKDFLVRLISLPTMAGFIRMLLKRHRDQVNLKELAVTDPLTGVYNRRQFMISLNAERHRALRYRRKLSVLMIDIDHFKMINDSYGHAVGDEVLRSLVKVCASKLRSIDIFARYGGEEFIVALPENGVEEAVKAAERIRKSVELLSANVNGSSVKCTISIGVAEWLISEQDVSVTVERADKALYKAKLLGRNRVAVMHE